MSSMPENDVREALGALELFEGAPPAVLERLAAAAQARSASPAGEYLFREGDPGDRISVIASGSMEAIMRLPGGREVEVEPLRPGGLIGEMAVLAERPRRFSVRATEDSTRLELRRRRHRPARSYGAARGRAAVWGAWRSSACGTSTRASLSCAARTHARMDPRALPSSMTQARWWRWSAKPEETAYLETVLFFSRFSAAEIEDLFGDLRRLEAPRGATVVAASEQGPALLIVLRGAVETSIRRGGLAARTRLAGPGRIVGHLNLLGEEPPLIVSRARERSILLEVPLDRIARRHRPWR